MSRKSGTLPPSYFEGLYEKNPDPWSFATSPYEREKYDATLAALQPDRYRRGLEIGCSIGVLTQRLAERCDALVAMEPVADALADARRRCADATNVRFLQATVPGTWPEGSFDLILLSEVVYYLDHEDIARLAEHVAGALAPSGDVVLVHWTGETDYPLDGDEAVRSFADRLLAAGTTRPDTDRSFRAERYRLDVLTSRAT